MTDSTSLGGFCFFIASGLGGEVEGKGQIDLLTTATVRSSVFLSCFSLPVPLLFHSCGMSALPEASLPRIMMRRGAGSQQRHVVGYRCFPCCYIASAVC